MKVEVRLTTDNDAYIIKNLYPLYLHDLSEFDGSLPNSHGLIGEEENVRTLEQQGEVQKTWWERPRELFPYLILADGRPAGFNLIAGKPFVPVEGIDYEVHEFFLLHAFRGKGVGERAAVEGDRKYPGRWEVVTYPGHAAAAGVWRRVLRDYTQGNFTEAEIDHPWGRKISFRFSTPTV